MNQILYVQRKLNSTRLIIILAIILVFCIVFISTIFSILNKNNTNIIAGVKINNIDLSNLSIADATQKLSSDFVLPEATQTIDIIVDGIKYTTPISNLGITPDYDAMIKNAYNVGRNKSFIVNNYTIQGAYMFGVNIAPVYTINDDIFNKLLVTLKEKIIETKTDDTYTISEEYITITKGINGIALDIDKLKATIINNFAVNNFNAITAELQHLNANKIDLTELYNEITVEPINASTVVENDTILFKEHSDGVTFNLADAIFLYDNSAEEKINIPLIRTKATITSDSLAQEMFKDTLSTYSSTYKEYEKNRTVNVTLAASKINGVILMPGQEFSFNKVVGERTTKNGFKTATIYANNQLAQGLGGGICQVSSTLYNSVLLLNLKVTERKNHQLSVSYVPLGRDATVVWDRIDFKFTNTRTTPIKLVTTASNGTLTISILGTKTTEEPEIVIKTVTDSSKKYSTEYIKDTTMPEGKTITVQNGAYGYTVSTYLIVKKNGEEISNTLISQDTYNPMKAIVKIGTAVSTEPTNPDKPTDPNNPSNPNEDIPDPLLPPGWDVPENTNI